MMDIPNDTDAVSSHQNQDAVPSPTNGQESTRMERVGYQTSPHAPNTPENNVCKLVSYRGTKVASFTVSGRELICLPQAFELFLKHLVGGLHTVYTKLKRLEIIPVCNVEQVRILRGVAAIQPGVNRCKLISPHEFDVLYDDCTSSSARPGRPPKRSSFISELAESSPTKMLRRESCDSPHIYNGGSYHDVKNLGLPTPGLLASFQGYPNSLAGLSFMSPYQLNLMHQAAMRMALANQLQSNISTQPVAADSSASLPAAFSKQTSATTINHTASPSHNNPDCHLQILLPSNRNQANPATLENGRHFGDENSEKLSPSSNHHVEIDGIETPPQVTIPTPPLSSPRDTEFTYLNNKPIKPATHSHVIADQPIKSLSQSHSSTIPSSRRNGADSPNAGAQQNVNDESFKRQLRDGTSCESAHNILLTIISDIKSFTDSVLQHQQDLIADIESLRVALLHSPQSEVSDNLISDQFDASRIIQEQRRQELEYQDKITQLLRHSKSDLGTKHRRWWADKSGSI